jgi:hypothetical protein
MNDIIHDDDDDGFHLTPSDRIIRGTFVKWTDAESWNDRDGTPPPPVMLVTSCAEILQHWEEKRVIDVIRELPLPDLDTLNSTIPKAQWEIGLDGKPRPPWQRAYVIYMLDLVSGTPYTYINSTTGARIAFEQLNERVVITRMLRNARVVPLVRLEQRPFKTSFGMRSRPHFEILEWRQFGEDGGLLGGPPSPQLTGPASASTPTSTSTPPPASTSAATKPATPSAATEAMLSGLPKVAPPTLSEEMRDELPW